MKSLAVLVCVSLSLMLSAQDENPRCDSSILGEWVPLDSNHFYITPHGSAIADISFDNDGELAGTWCEKLEHGVLHVYCNGFTFIQKGDHLILTVTYSSTLTPEGAVVDLQYRYDKKTHYLTFKDGKDKFVYKRLE